jgi:hypothetical protein
MTLADFSLLTSDPGAVAREANDALAAIVAGNSSPMSFPQLSWKGAQLRGSDRA